MQEFLLLIYTVHQGATSEPVTFVDVKIESSLLKSAWFFRQFADTGKRWLLYTCWIFIFVVKIYRLRWSRGSVLAFGTQVRGFKPVGFLRAKKILSAPSFGGEVKPSVPCRKFAACKRSLELRGSRILDEICRNISRPRRVPRSAARGLSRRWT